MNKFERPLFAVFIPKAACQDATTLQTSRLLAIVPAMDKVFILQHERPETETLLEDVKFIGAYSSETAAQAAIERLRAQPGFRDFPNDFTIDAYEIDRDHWTEGFILG